MNNTRKTVERSLKNEGVLLEAETKNLAITTAEADHTVRIHFKRTGEIQTVANREMRDLISQIKECNYSNLSDPNGSIDRRTLPEEVAE